MTQRSQVLFLSGELDAFSAGQLRARLDDLTRNRAGDLVVDLADVTFIDAAGVAALVNTDAQLHANGARLVVTSPTKLTARVLRAAGASDLLA